MRINVTYPADYPPVEVSGPNLKLARLLNNDLAAVKSETTAIHQYLYQAWMLEGSRTELSTTLSDIARVEMHHMRILGRLIVLLGGSPRFFSYPPGRVLPWNGKMVNYDKDIRHILAADISDEELAYQAYTQQAKTTKDEKVAANLTRIAQDEKLHKAVFEKFLQDL